MKVFFLLILLLFCVDTFAHKPVAQNNLTHRTSDPLLVKTITLNEDPWPPYIHGVEGQEATNGIAIDILRLVFKRLDIEVSLPLFPWQCSVKLVKQGFNDGHILLVPSPQWSQYMVYSIPFIEDKFLLWFSADRSSPIEWQSVTDLSGYSIALTSEYSYGDSFEASAKNAGVILHYSKTDEINFRLLAAKRVDAVVCLERVAQSLFKKHPHLQRQFITASTPIESVTMMMSIAKDSPAAVLMPQINQQLKMLITDGNIEKIIRRYD